MKYLVRLHYGRTVMPCREFTTYRAARRYARGLRRASVRPVLGEREARALCALACVALSALAYIQLGA